MKTAQRSAMALAIGMAFATAASAATAASVDYFLSIDGIKGESVDDRHKGEIDILSWSVGVSQAPPAPGARASKPCVQDISFAKRVDLASPLLLANAASGMPIRGATLVARKAGGDQQEFLKVELKDILVTSVQSGGSSGGDPTEQFTLSFGSMQVRYQAQDPKGGPGETVTTNFKGGC